jgi:hypothetical protein
MKIQIRKRWDLSIIFECEADSMKLAVELAIKNNANLSSANLSSADLSSANLSSADLSSADLRWANLSSANLSSANLSSANLRWANLSSADLRWANLSSANLSSADLSSADLSSADLSSANLSSADLSSADLRWAEQVFIRDDIWAVLSCAPSEVSGLRQALIEGKIDGSCYEGNCACLVGTIANVRGCGYTEISALKPNSSRASERFFMGINKGDTPETNQISKQVLIWIDEWLFNMKNAFGKEIKK